MNDQIISEEEGIDLLEVINELWSQKLILSLLALFFIGSSSIIALNLPQYWTASTTLMIVEGAKGGGGAPGALAGMVGVKLGSSNISNGQIAAEIARSKDFFKYLIKDEKLLIDLIAIKDFQNGKNIYDPEIYDFSSKKWVQGKPSFFSAYNGYRSAVSVNYDWELGGFMSASVTHRSPIFASELLEKLIVNLNDQYRDRDLKEADRSLKYLANMSSSVTNSDLRRSVSSLMQNQLKTKMFANVKEYYLVEPLDSVYVPQLRSKPKRTQIVLISTILGMLLSCLVVIVRKQVLLKP
ncbi:Wzz/FepE/Etk N-terminal domain-containing protein [Gammaproteobacteria bacterium]|nr:Wzz/FepE/Etk N-terminal domain-containing protein [Gammaproteobacteria bacterium]MDC0129005.1 Wzz/FepE/Etk N-terminal domain-containing protein [Gammaproteobacteria bacterium]